MCDISTGKRGDITIINTNVAYNLSEKRSTGHMGEGVEGREDGENIDGYAVVGTSRSGLSSQRKGESSIGTVGGGNITPAHIYIYLLQIPVLEEVEVRTCMWTCKVVCKGPNWITLFIINE